jgi:hypothetical protein
MCGDSADCRALCGRINIPLGPFGVMSVEAFESAIKSRRTWPSRNPTLCARNRPEHMQQRVVIQAAQYGVMASSSANPAARQLWAVSALPSGDPSGTVTFDVASQRWREVSRRQGIV